jgi:hypothetical protein
LQAEPQGPFNRFASPGYCTITWPIIHGCGAQLYTNVPAESNVIVAEPLDERSPVSH